MYFYSVNVASFGKINKDLKPILDIPFVHEA